jgi:hypothetical protein
MPKKILNVVESAYRCTIEEQDDPVVWIAAVMRGAGGDTHLLLRGNAVNYAAKNQDASGLSFGGRVQTQPPRIDQDLEKVIAKGVEVYLVEEDAAERGLERGALIAGLKPVSRAGVAKLYGGFDQIWHW